MGKNRAGYWPMNQIMENVSNVEEVAKVIVKGYANVTMGATAMNERSSRGHTIITIKVSTGNDNSTSLQNKIAKIQVVDLAGSERAAATDGPAKTGGVTRLGTFQEGNAINKSLYNLGLMVKAAGERPRKKGLTDEQRAQEVAKNIRLQSNNSLLTKLLLDSIGGNVASFLIVAVRDERRFFNEIKSSLEFGEKCRDVKNNPKEMIDAANLQAQLAHIKIEHEKLKRERDELMRQLKVFGFCVSCLEIVGGFRGALI